jgi:hypothetical protein
MDSEQIKKQKQKKYIIYGGALLGVIVVITAIILFVVNSKTKSLGTAFTFTKAITSPSLTGVTLAKTGLTALTDNLATSVNSAGPLLYEVSDFGKTITMMDPAKVTMSVGSVANVAGKITITWTNSSAPYTGTSSALLPLGTWTGTAA